MLNTTVVITHRASYKYQRNCLFGLINEGKGNKMCNLYNIMQWRIEI